MSHKVSSLLLVLLALAITAGNAQTKPLTNNDIVQMTKANFDEQTIVKARGNVVVSFVELEHH